MRQHQIQIRKVSKCNSQTANLKHSVLFHHLADIKFSSSLKSRFHLYHLFLNIILSAVYDSVSKKTVNFKIAIS
jgi:hypothetical protein